MAKADNSNGGWDENEKKTRKMRPATLVELLVVIAIIIVLLAFPAPAAFPPTPAVKLHYGTLKHPVQISRIIAVVE